MIQVVVGIICNQQGEVLIAQRPAHQYCGGMWEFPGGKIEFPEPPFKALQREFLEEIGIEILSADPWFKIQHEYTDRVVLLDVWIINQYQGEPKGVEGQVIQWVLPQQFYQYEFPEGNREILSRLKEGKGFHRFKKRGMKGDHGTSGKGRNS